MFSFICYLRSPPTPFASRRSCCFFQWGNLGTLLRLLLGQQGQVAGGVTLYELSRNWIRPWTSLQGKNEAKQGKAVLGRAYCTATKTVHGGAGRSRHSDKYSPDKTDC